MFNFWEWPDFIYKKTAAYRFEQQVYNKARQLAIDIVDKKLKDLDDKLAVGIDILEQERNSNTLSFIHKCFLMVREAGWTKQMVLAQVETILAGGIDTSAITVTNTMIMLAMHPDDQERCVEEILALNLDDKTDITQDHIAKLPYLQMCVQESLRLFPAGSYLARTCIDPLPLSKRWRSIERIISHYFFFSTSG